ncbi:MAG: SUMF1/EgtB/PvdO family nonheme iron enzyme [Parachlamydiaceae bacterium]|nr:SUMF1/EgtB/PvdO family nonheme iron enzyme [Parachlamydiaceae bacterium]
MFVKHPKLHCLSLLFLFSIIFGSAFSNETGTLIVTFETNQAKERLDRIRFWLINEKDEHELYPKNNQFVDSHQSGFSTTVAIPSLTPGIYYIEFIVPNHDGFFEEVVPKTVIIRPGETVKIDQVIHSKIFPNIPKKDIYQVLSLLKKPEIKPLFKEKSEIADSNENFANKNLINKQTIQTDFVENLPNNKLEKKKEEIIDDEIKNEMIEEKPVESDQSLNKEETTQTTSTTSKASQPISAPLVLKTLGPTHVVLTSPKNKKIIIDEIFTQNNNTLFLPEGHYLLTYQRLDDKSNLTKSTYVTVHNSLPRTLELFSSLSTEDQDIHVHKEISLKKNLPSHQFVNVPGGVAIVGDPFTDSHQNERPAKQINIPEFSIGVYPVTNQEFAAWVTQEIVNKNFQIDISKPGHIFDREGQLICKTTEANPLSQLTIKPLPTNNQVLIEVLNDKELYPVINVTWFGASAYCKSHGGRLLSEYEWEKAAGMTISKDGSIGTRYKYGFGKNEIDRTWANYRDPSRIRDSSLVLTNPVGFYNGVNQLPVTLQERSITKTNDAKSPVGAYDMSGNVWEWVTDWDEKSEPNNFKIVKGGCYDSTADGVRVSERLALPPGYCDVFTGFRVAK